jgi:hypothetical protein
MRYALGEPARVGRKKLMSKVAEQERIQALEAKLKQLKTVQQRREAKARSVALHRSRRDELRRKILVGAVVLAKVEDGSLEEAVLRGWMDKAVTRADDRALFGLDASHTCYSYHGVDLGGHVFPGTP